MEYANEGAKEKKEIAKIEKHVDKYRTGSLSSDNLKK